MTENEERRDAVAEAMSLRDGLVVQEIGWDDDVDEALRESIMDAIDADLVEDTDESVDAVLLWWREDDGDVTDGLMDSLRDLSATGTVWLMTPKVGRPGHVEPADVQEGAMTAGLALTGAVGVSAEWQAARLVRTKGARK